MGKRKKRQGHFCWSCQRYLANERFSGRGHRRHLCKKCSRLGREELSFRQAVRNIDRCLDWNGRIRRRQKKTFERYRDDPNPRVRAYMEEILDRQSDHREEFQEYDEIREGMNLSEPECLEIDWDSASDDELPF